MDNETGTSLLEFTATVVNEIRKNGNEKVFFSWYDYILFSTLLAISGGIGIYFGCFGNRQNTAKEYLMGGNQMKVIPITISLVASHCSGITLLAVPADVYVFGATYWLGAFSMIILAVVTIYVYLPVFYKLQLTSTYEYLGLRFDKRTRKCSSFLFAVSVFFYLPIVVYIPALAFSAATGIDVHIVTPVVCGICIFYTTIGGLKALVWSDSLQFSITIGAIATTFYLGISSIGGMEVLWEKSIESRRLDIFDFDLDPTKRETFWAIMVGLTVHWIAHTSVNQGCTQKFLSVPTLEDSKKAVILYALGMTLVKTMSVLSGLIMAVKYSHCDPFTTKKIQRNDQLFPYYVLDVAGGIPGLSGLFIAGVFCASLSALSANLNSLAGTIYEDFLKRFFRKNDKVEAGHILKMLVVIIGVLSTGLVYIVEHLGGLLSLAIGLGSVAHGPLMGMFTLGFLFPRANGKGAFYGAITSMATMAIIIMGGHYYKSKKLIRYPHKPVSVDECDILFNATSFTNATSPVTPDTYVLPIFKISFYWYTFIGSMICMVVGLIISYMTEENDPPVSKELLSPVIYRFLSNNKHSEKLNLMYSNIEGALEKVVNGTTEIDIPNEPVRRKSLRKERLRTISDISDVIDD